MWITRWRVWAILIPVFLAIAAVSAFVADLVQITGIDIFTIKTPTIPAPPASEKLYYMTVVDASDRMLSSIGGSEQKWEVAVRSLRDKLSILPSGANFGLVTFGQAGSLNPLPCNEAAEVLVPVNDLMISEEVQAGSSQQRALSAAAGITPGSKGSLTKAISLAVDQLVSGLPDNYSKTIIVVTGGGDACNPQAEWDSLEFLLSGVIKDLSLYTELIIFVDEEVKEEIAAKVQKISRLEGVTVSLPTTAEELNEDLEDAVDRAVERGMAVEPLPFIVQETIVAATQISQSVNANVPVATNIPEVVLPIQPVLTFTQLSPNNTAPLPTAMPFIVLTNTSTRSPTSTSTNPPPTQIPTTAIPPTPIPATPVPPTHTPAEPAFICQLARPSLNGASFGGVVTITSPGPCSSNHASGTAIDTRGTEAGIPAGTVIWVFVYPPNGPYYPQSPNACSGPISPPPNNSGGNWDVPSYLGNIGDTPRTFDIVVAVVDQATSDTIGARLYEDCANGMYDGISAAELSTMNIMEKAFITVGTR